MSPEARELAVKLYERDRIDHPERVNYVRAWRDVRDFLQESEKEYPRFDTIGLPSLKENVDAIFARANGFNGLLITDTPQEALIGNWRYTGQRLSRSAFLLREYFGSDESDIKALSRLSGFQKSMQDMYEKNGIMPHDLSDIKFPLPTSADRNRAKYEEYRAPVTPSLLKDSVVMGKVNEGLKGVAAVYCDIARVGFDIPIPTDTVKSQSTLLIAKNNISRKLP